MISAKDFEMAEDFFNSLPSLEDQSKYLETLKKYSETEDYTIIHNVRDSQGKRMQFGVFMDFPPSPQHLALMQERLNTSCKKLIWSELEQEVDANIK